MKDSKEKNKGLRPFPMSSIWRKKYNPPNGYNSKKE